MVWNKYTIHSTINAIHVLSVGGNTRLSCATTQWQCLQLQESSRPTTTPPLYTRNAWRFGNDSSIYAVNYITIQHHNLFDTKVCEGFYLRYWILAVEQSAGTSDFLLGAVFRHRGPPHIEPGTVRLGTLYKSLIDRRAVINLLSEERRIANVSPWRLLNLFTLIRNMDSWSKLKSARVCLPNLFCRCAAEQSNVKVVTSLDRIELVRWKGIDLCHSPEFNQLMATNTSQAQS